MCCMMTFLKVHANSSYSEIEGSKKDAIQDMIKRLRTIQLSTTIQAKERGLGPNYLAYGMMPLYIFRRTNYLKSEIVCE